jgi:hypothetical protein
MNDTYHIVEYASPARRELRTREDCASLCLTILIELEKINIILDKVFEACQAQKDAEEAAKE